MSQQQVAQLLEEPPEVLVEHYGIEDIKRRTCSPEGDASSKAESRHWLLELTRIVRLQIASSIQESAHEFLIDDLIILDTQQADDPGGSLGYQFMTGDLNSIMAGLTSKREGLTTAAADCLARLLRTPVL